MAVQPHSRIESQLTDPTYNGPYLSRIELILKDMLENYGRIAFVGPYDSLEDLPETGEAGYVYLVKVEGSYLCDEYIWDEKNEVYNYVGRFEIDLADYQTKDLITPIIVGSVTYTTVEAAMGAMNTSLSGKANSSDLGTAASKNSTNQLSDGSVDLIEAGVVKTALDGKVNTHGTDSLMTAEEHTKLAGIDLTQYEKSGVAETLIKDTVGWSGKNLYNGEYELGAIGSDGSIVPSEIYCHTDYIDVKEGKSYFFSAVNNGSVQSKRLHCYDANKNWLSNPYIAVTSGTTIYSMGGIMPANTAFVRISFAVTDTNVQFEENDHATSYEPYHPTVDTVKADKVTNATSGHLAGLDSNGNLTDSGVSPTEDVTVEGNPVTFDSPFEQDAKSVVVSVKPIQDLHGYDHPWPAGGGKNKIGAIGGWNANGELEPNASAIRSEKLPVNEGDQFVASKKMGFSASWSSLMALLYDSNGDYISQSIFLAASAGSTIQPYTVPSGASFIAFSVYLNATDYANIDTFEVQVEKGATITTFAPYSNICPISGIDEVEIPVSDGESEPTTTTILLPSTLYGGEENLTDGSGDSTHELKAISASDDIVFAVLHSGCDLFKLNGVSYKAEGNIISNMFKGDIDFAGAYSAYINSTGNVIFAVPTGLYNASQFKAFLVEQGCTICCELATPTTLSFTPADVELLEGTNVVSTNAEKVAVTYGRSFWQDIDELKTDTEGKVDKSNVADVEGDTASRPYSVNEFMLRADGLYKVTQPIAQNASITASNTTKTTIGAVLTALLNA